MMHWAIIVDNDLNFFDLFHKCNEKVTIILAIKIGD